MRILHVFPFYSIKKGGGTTWLIDQLAKAQTKNGHKVEVLVGDFKFDTDNLNKNNSYSVRKFKSYFNFFGIYLMPSLIFFAYNNLNKYDIIHIHLFRSIQNIIICLFAIKFKVPYIIDAHGSLPRHIWYKKFKKTVYDITFGNLILKNAKICIAENELSYKEYIDFGISDDKISIIRPPFPIEDYVSLPKKGIFQSENNLLKFHLITFMGRIHWIKGIDILLHAYIKLLKKRKDIMLIIVGEDDGYKQNLKKIIDKEDLNDRVLFTGYLSGDKKLSCLVDSSVVVQTSRYEQGAGVPLEAVLCNTPIIVSDNSGAGLDVKRLNAGFIVKFGDVDELSSTIDYVINNQEESVAKTVLGANRVKQSLSIKNNILEYDLVYKLCNKE